MFLFDWKPTIDRSPSIDHFLLWMIVKHVFNSTNVQRLCYSFLPFKKFFILKIDILIMLPVAKIMLLKKCLKTQDSSRKIRE